MQTLSLPSREKFSKTYELKRGWQAVHDLVVLDDPSFRELSPQQCSEKYRRIASKAPSSAASAHRNVREQEKHHEEIERQQGLRFQNSAVSTFHKERRQTGGGPQPALPPEIAGDDLPATHPGHPDFVNPPPSLPHRPHTQPTIPHNPRYDLLKTQNTVGFSRPPQSAPQLTTQTSDILEQTMDLVFPTSSSSHTPQSTATTPTTHPSLQYTLSTTTSSFTHSSFTCTPSTISTFTHSSLTSTPSSLIKQSSYRDEARKEDLPPRSMSTTTQSFPHTSPCVTASSHKNSSYTDMSTSTTTQTFSNTSPSVTASSHKKSSFTDMRNQNHQLVYDTHQANAQEKHNFIMESLRRDEERKEELHQQQLQINIHEIEIRQEKLRQEKLKTQLLERQIGSQDVHESSHI